MSISTAQIRTAVKTAVAAISGVRTVYDKVPRTLQPVELPVAIVLAGREDYNYAVYGDTQVQQGTAVQVQVYVSEANAGTEYTPETDAETLMDTVKRYFWQ